MRLLISAGEASGETYGAQLVEAIRKRAPEARFLGVGGERMRAAGCDLVVHARDVAVVGLTEVITHLPKILAAFRKLVRSADDQRPEAAILIDFPDFNLRLAKRLHRRGIPVIYYVSPQLWAWRPRRIKLVQRFVRKMLVIFPFEEQFYREHDVHVEFVGHPLAGVPRPTITRHEFAQRHNLHPSKQWIALLPGSRRKEVKMNLSAMLEAAERLGPGYEYVVPVASTLERNTVERLLGSPAVPIKLTHDARATLLHARAAVVASGTATVEAALMGTPFVMVYRLSALTYLLGRRFVRVSRFAMVNLIAEREVVPELVQAEFTAENIMSHLQRLIPEGVAREEMIAGLAEVRRRLGAGGEKAAERAAEAVLQILWSRTVETLS